VSGSLNKENEEEIKKHCYIACLKSYCYTNDICGKPCALLTFCPRVCNAYGFDDGEFDKWTFKDLQKAAKMIKCHVSIKADNVKKEID